MAGNWQDVLTAVLKSPAVWAGLVALLNALQHWLLPDVPPDVVAAVNTLIVGIAAVFGVVLTSFQAGARAATQQMISERVNPK